MLLETDNIYAIPELQKVIEKYPVELKIINFNNVFDDIVKNGNNNRNTKFSNFTFARLFLPSIVEEDKVLYMDTDTIVLNDISELWNINIDNYYVAGCKDYKIFDVEQYKNREHLFNYKYINAGILLMNLKELRKNDIQKKFFESMNEKKYPLLDQDVINIICGDKKLYISNKYNYFDGNSNESFDENKIKIIHYVGDKNPWVKDKKYSKYWYIEEEKFYIECNGK